MSFLNRLFGTKPSSELTPQPPQHEPTAQEIAKNPELFADWVNKCLILYPSFEEDLALAPNEEQCQSMQVSQKERLLCANEFVLLRALGACMFVQSWLGEQNYLSFRAALLPSVIERMKSNAPPLHHDDPSEALDMYFGALDPDSHVPFSMTYLERVYPDSPSGGSIFLQGIPIHIGFKYTMMMFDIVRDSFAELLTGMNRDQISKLVEFLISRFEMIQEGKVYLFEGRQPTDPLHATIIDTTFLLIGLVGSTSDQDGLDRTTAIEAVRFALWCAVHQLSPDRARGKTIDAIDFDLQIVILDHYLENPDENFMLEVIYAAHSLYSIEVKENSQLLGTIAGTIALNDVNDILTFAKRLISK